MAAEIGEAGSPQMSGTDGKGFAMRRISVVLLSRATRKSPEGVRRSLLAGVDIPSNTAKCLTTN